MPSNRSLRPPRCWTCLPWLCLVVATMPFTGCQKVMDQVNALLGDKGGDVKKAAKRAKEDPKLEKLRGEAINKVQRAKAREGWNILKEVENYKKIAAKLAKKKKLPKPTGFKWTAICASGGTCRVILAFWDGRTPHQAAWLVSSDIEPINCWALSFMARSKAALACFQKEARAKAKQQASQQAKASKRSKAPAKRRPGARGAKDPIWETSGSAKDIKAAANGNTQAPPMPQNDARKAPARPTPRR